MGHARTKRKQDKRSRKPAQGKTHHHSLEEHNHVTASDLIAIS
jgi:hypothetical protein